MEKKENRTEIKVVNRLMDTNKASSRIKSRRERKLALQQDVPNFSLLFWFHFCVLFFCIHLSSCNLILRLTSSRRNSDMKRMSIEH